MELSRERKIFVGVAIVAGAAFVIDRGILAPSGASAAPVISITPPAGAEPGQGDQLGGIDETGIAIAQRLHELVVSEGVSGEASGDAFVFPESWTTPIAAPAEAAESGDSAAAAPTFKLSAAMPTTRGGIAVIDGRTYRTGDRVGSYTLVGVMDRAVTLEGPGGLVTLEVER